MDLEFRPVVRKQRHNKQADSDSIAVLHTLYAEGLRHHELDEKSRTYMAACPPNVQVKALNALLNKRRAVKVNNPSAYLIQALQTCSLDGANSLETVNRGPKTARPALCQSANQLLSWLHKEGLHPDKLDEASYVYLSQCPPPVQTQALTQFLTMWRGETLIQNPSAYLTKLVNNAMLPSEQHHDQAYSKFSEAPNVQVKAPAMAPLAYVPFKQFALDSFAAVDDVTGALSPPQNSNAISTDVWPAVHEAFAAVQQTVTPIKQAAIATKPLPSESSPAKAALMRCFANRFVVMNDEDLTGLQMQDLEIILKVQGESGISSALDGATENAEMMPMYDLVDEAGQRELLLRELEFSAETIVDDLTQRGSA